MITAIDTNIILDVLIPSAPYGSQSERQIRESVRAGTVIINDVVYAELAVHFPDAARLDEFLHRSRIEVQPTGRSALFEAGRSWAAYLRRRPASLECPSCGAPQMIVCANGGTVIRSRQHVLADFIIGAHALAHADRLLTRDRRFYGTNFPSLTLG